MADKKVSELDAIAGSATAADDLFLIVDASGSVTKKITRAELNNAIEQDVLSTVDINGGTIDSTVIGGTTPAAGDFTTLGATGNITVGGTVDGRDVAADGTKLDGIATSATANPNAIDNVVEDTSPQLGGALDVNGNSITSASNGDITIDPNGTGDIVLDANVQIGTTTEGIADYGDTLTLADTGHAGMTIRSGTSSEGNVYFSDGTSGDAEYKGIVKYDHSTNAMSFWSNSLRRVTIDSSGNLLVGKTADNVATVGIEARATGPLISTRDGSDALRLNRLNSDGEIIQLRKDGTAAGSIGVINNNNLIISNDADNSGLQFGSGSITPAYDGAGQDNSVDLGSSSTRFKDGYFSGQVAAQFFTGVGDTDTYMDIAANPANTIKFFTGGNERMRLTSAGLLGLGTSSPADTNSFGNALDIQSATGAGLYLRESDATSNYGLVAADQSRLYLHHQGEVVVRTGGANTRMTIDSSGKVGINCTPDATFKVVSSGANLLVGFNGTQNYFDASENIFRNFAGSERARFDSSGRLLIATSSLINNDGAYLQSNGGSNLAFGFNVNYDGTLGRFYRSSSIVGSISVTTSNTAYNTSSDRRLKSNIEDAASASDKIDAIQVRQFDWNVDDSHQDYGLIAQELQPIEPLAVTGSADSDEMMGVDYSKLVPMLIKEIQELRSRVAALEAN